LVFAQLVTPKMAGQKQLANATIGHSEHVCRFWNRNKLEIGVHD